VAERIVVVGASAGGVEALQRLVGALPEDLPAAVLVVLHIPSEGPSVLPAILSRAGPLEATAAEHGEALEAGRVYTAPADRHLTVHQGRVELTSGPKENGVRPAIDVLFRSVAIENGPGAIGVVLSGTLDDGAAGLAVIRGAGGLGLVQDPEDALYRSMPDAAIATAGADEVASVEVLAAIIQERLGRDPHEGGGMDVDLGHEQASPFSCPDCGGVLWHSTEEWRHFRCRVGHAYSAQALLNGQRSTLEESLWVAVRVLEERADLSRRLAGQSEAAGRRISARSFTEGANRITEHAEAIRSLVEDLAPWMEPIADQEY
jgi:two-component system chemotaxis response regulator CheB